MIIDILSNRDRYSAMHPGFAAAFSFIHKALREGIGDGEYEIDGRNLYATVSSVRGKGRGGAKLEAHRKYIDIQLAISGTDTIGWKPIGNCLKPEEAYNQARDIILFSDTADMYIPVTGQLFSVLYPEDAHAPLACEGFVRKIVVKIAV
ncbi:MAG: YhcH/YjgK/YiaL family protein [Candidatus Omnitrophica bacterium]|nr:YhcH/YjgK/YiaL family protein [Candidatus Omnitrophota bacterium]